LGYGTAGSAGVDRALVDPTIAIVVGPIAPLFGIGATAPAGIENAFVCRAIAVII